MAASKSPPTPVESLIRQFDGRRNVSFSPSESVVIALAWLGRRSMAITEAPGALSLIGLRFPPGYVPPPAAFVTPGWTELRDDRIHIAKGTTADTLVNALIARLRAASAPPKSPSKPPPKPPSKPPSKPPPRPAPTPVAAPLPPPPPFTPAARRRDPFDLARLLACLAAAPSTPAALAHTLDAHALASAEHFEELLAPGVLRGVEPHTYQLETVRRVLRHFRGRALLADEVGLGKTVEAIMVLREYQLRGMVRRVLILVPPALVGQWESELREKAGLSPLVAAEIDAKGDFWRQDGLILASQGLARGARHANVLVEQAWDLVIVDEAHRLKNRSTLAWKLVDGLKSRFLLMLTATPVETDLEELYNLVTLLRPGQLSTLADFRKRYVDPKDATTARDPQRLRELLAEVMVRNTRANSGLMLPPRYVTTVATDPSPAEQRMYAAVVALLRKSREQADGRRLADTLMLEAGSSPFAVLASLIKVRAQGNTGAFHAELTDLETLTAAAATSAKGVALLDILRAHNEKILVFTRFRETLSYVEQLARNAGIATVVLHGGLDRKHKDDALLRFRGDAQLLLCTDVGSEGHNLQFCHILVNFDLPWNPMIIEQRIGRLHRYGQTEPVRVYNLCATGTAEERLLDVLDRRVHLFELVVGEMDMVIGNVVEQQDLEARVLSIYAKSKDDSELSAEFDAIADELSKARGQYEQVKALDQALFGKEFEA